MKVVYLVILLCHFRNSEETILRLEACNKVYAAFTKIRKQSILSKSTYSLVASVNVQQCEIMCVQNAKCKSISISDDGNQCMLHHSRSGEKGTVLQVKHGWTHVETDDQLENLGPFCRTVKPCPCGKCIDTCDSIGYRCECKGVTPLGCFKDLPDDRALSRRLANFRSEIVWTNIKATIEKCAAEAKKYGYTVYAIQFYGECWGGEDAASTYNRHGPATTCWSGVGREDTNYVYRLIEE